MSYEVKDFQKDVLEKSQEKPVLVDFWAEWCGPCKVLGPVLEKLVEQADGEWILAKVDTDKNQDLAAKYGIRGIPNCKLFSKGEVINEFTGALSEQVVNEWLKKAVPGKYAESIEKAKVLLEDGNLLDAKVILEDVLKGDMNNNAVKVLLAKILLFEEPEEASRLVHSAEVTGELLELSDSIKTLSKYINKKEIKKEADGEVKNDYIKAVSQLKQRNFDEALGLFINVIRTDRKLDDDGARKACIAIFKYLGEEHEITLKHRRDFGSALYV